MVERIADTLSPIFRALADPTRREMLRSLADEERTVGELAEPFAMSLAAASKHVRVLERVGLITRSRSSGDGRRRYVHLHRRALDILRAGAGAAFGPEQVRLGGGSAAIRRADPRDRRS